MIYCDHSATTPVAPEVLAEMQRVSKDVWGNPSSVHQIGRTAKVQLEYAREAIAHTLHAARNEILFTSGGTEANNFVLRGLVEQLRDRGNHIITSSVEHHAVLETCKALERQGVQVTYLDVDQYGRVSLEAVENAITDQTILITIMHANNEIGTINPIEEIGELAQKRGIIFHSDAVQTYGKLHIDTEKMPIDALSVSGHKIYGPKGIGFLFLKKGIAITPQLTGGSQERNLRAGTENLPAIAGLVKATELIFASSDAESMRLRKLQNQLESMVLETIDGSKIHGHPEQRIPGLSNIGFDGVDGESLVMNLDMRGIAVSSGSACSSGSVNPSHVLMGMGYDKTSARSAIRISLGKSNSEQDIPVIVSALQEEVERVRNASEKRKKTRAKLAHV